MPRFSRATKTVFALLAGGAAIIGIGATNHAAPARVAPLLGGSFSSLQKQGGRSVGFGVRASDGAMTDGYCRFVPTVLT